jgi:signal transduction histidine kinase
METEKVAVEVGGTFLVDLRPLFEPQDALERLQYTKAHVVPWRNRDGVLDAAVFLSGLKQPNEPIQADDLLPIELLVSRLSAMREHDELAQRYAQSEKLVGLGQLAAGVAHELGNPLTVVMGYAELLEEVFDGQAAQSSVTVIRNESKRMRKIIDSMLRLGKSWPVEYSAVSLQELLREVRELRKDEFSRRDIRLQMIVAEDLPLIRANRSQLQQVVLHMLDNALDAFDAYVGSEEKSVKIDLSHSKGTVRILMSDNGASFPDPQRAFDPFTSTRQPGVRIGLGLSLCYAVVREHGGEITVHNTDFPQRLNGPRFAKRTLGRLY